MSFLFESLSAGLEAGRRMMVDRIGAAVIRLYDGPSTQSRLKRILGFSLDGAYMVVGLEGDREIVDIQQRRVREIFRRWDGRDSLPQLDIVVHLKPEAGRVGFGALERELQQLLSRLSPTSERRSQGAGARP